MGKWFRSLVVLLAFFSLTLSEGAFAFVGVNVGVGGGGVRVGVAVGHAGAMAPCGFRARCARPCHFRRRCGGGFAFHARFAVGRGIASCGSRCHRGCGRRCF